MKGSALSATLPAGGLGQVGGQGRARVLPLLVLLLLIDRSEPKFPPTSGRRPLFPEAEELAFKSGVVGLSVSRESRDQWLTSKSSDIS